jgi:hypothetical protein
LDKKGAPGASTTLLRGKRSVLAQLVGDARLVAAEQGEVEVHGGYGSRAREHGEMHLVTGLHLQRFNELITIIHAERCRRTGLTDRLRTNRADDGPGTRLLIAHPSDPSAPTVIQPIDRSAQEAIDPIAEATL